jgi:hypothetical protein
MDENNLSDNMAQISEALNRNTEMLNSLLAFNMAMLPKEQLAKMSLETNIKGQAQAFDILGDSTRGYTRVQKDAYESAKKYQEAMNNFKAGLDHGQAAVESFTSKIYSGERSYSKYESTLKSLADGTTNVLNNFGFLGKTLGILTQGIAKVGGAYLEQADNVLKASDQMAKFGNAGAMTGEELLKLAHQSGVTSKNLDLLVKPLQSMGSGLVSLGNTVGDGTKAFGRLTSITNEQREAYNRLGVSQGELIQNQADYIKLQTISGRNLSLRNKDEASLRQASLEYTDNLLTLSALSGKDIETIKKENEAALSREETLIQTNLMEMEINRLRKTGLPLDEERAKKLEAELKARDALLVGIQNQVKDPKMVDAMSKFLATGAVTQESAMLARMGVPIEEFARRIKNGEDVTQEFLNSLKKQGDQTLQNVGVSAMHNKEVRELFGYSKEFLQFLGGRREKDEVAAKKEAEAKIKAAKESGKDPMQDTRAKMVTAEIQVATKFDEIVLAGNPLIKGFDRMTVAIGIATVALTGLLYVGAKKAGESLLQSGINAAARATGIGRVGAAAPVAGAALEAAAPVARAAAPVASAAGTATSLATGMSALTKTLGTVAKFAGKVALPLAAASAGYDAYKGYNSAEETLGIKDRKATTGEKLSSAAGGALSGLTFGLISSETISKGIAKVTGAGIGDKKPDEDKKAEDDSQKVQKVEIVANKPAIELERLKEQRAKVVDRGPLTNSPQSALAWKEVVNTLDKAIESKTKEVKASNTSGFAKASPETVKAFNTTASTLASAASTSSTTSTVKQDQRELQGQEKLEELERQRKKLEEKGPRTNTLQSKESYEEMLKTLDMAIADEKRKLEARPKAAEGGIFSGPKSGYPVELHGNEAVVPLSSKTALPDMFGNKTEDEDSADSKEEKENSEAFNKSLKDSDVVLKKLTGNFSKWNKEIEDQLELKEEEEAKLKDSTTGITGGFKTAFFDLTNFTKQIKVATGQMGSGASAGGSGGSSSSGGGGGSSGSGGSSSSGGGGGSSGGGGFLSSMFGGSSGGTEPGGSGGGAKGPTPPPPEGKQITEDPPVTKVLESGPGWVKLQKEDGGAIVKKGNANWRMNNPGNIRGGTFAQSHGAIGEADAGPSGRFAVFPTLEVGSKAKEDLLFSPNSKYFRLSIWDAMHRYAPASDNNDPANYAKIVAEEAGASINTVLADLNPGQRQGMLSAITKHEGFKPGKILQAQEGGIFDGPMTGYPVEHHGREITAPLDANSMLEKLATTPATQVTESASTTSTITETDINDRIIEMLTDKFDTMIAKLDDMITELAESNNTQSDLLKYSKI